MELTSEQVKDWQKKIELSLEWRKPYEDRWNLTIDYLKGLCFEGLDEDEERVYVNMVRPHINVVIPAVYSRNPDVLVVPRRKDQSMDALVIKRAEIMQNLLRYYLKELDIKTEVKLAILDAVLTGHGWIKTGYQTEFLSVEEENETIISKFLKIVGIKEQEEKYEFTPNEQIISERVWALRTSPFDIIVPMLSRRPQELRWIAERIIQPHEETLSNPDYDCTDLKPSVNANELLASLRGSKYRKLEFANSMNYDILYECWDGYTGNVYTLCEGHDRELQCKESGYKMLDSRYHPYVTLRFNEVTDEFYCQGDIEPAAPQLEELNEVRTKLNTHMQRYNRKYVGRVGSLSDKGKADLKAGIDGIYIEAEQVADDKPLTDAIMPVIDAPIPPEVYAIETRVKDDIFTILGTSDYASQASGGARTATEANIIAMQSRHKVEERIDLVGGFLERILRNLAQISQEYMDEEQVGSIVGDDAIFWVQVFNRREIQGEFDYNVAYGSTTPVNEEADREQFMSAYAIMRDDPYFDQVKLRLELIRKSKFNNPESWMNPQFIQELEMQRMLLLKKGMLTPGNPSQDRSGSSGGAGRVPDPSKRGSHATNDLQRLGGMSGSHPERPGGKGGTELVKQGAY